jgi:hypothetical protein
MAPARPAAAPISNRQLIFIGVDWGHLPSWEKVLDEDRRTPAPGPMWVKSNSGMSPAIPAWLLEDLLNSEEMVMKRAEDDKKIADARKVIQVPY